MNRSPIKIDFRHSSAEDFLPTVADDSVDLILVDPPYFREISEEWDRQWSSEPEFLEWLAGMCAEWSRVLRHNGSLYCFASPSMSWKVASVIGRRFNVLNLIRWGKPSSAQACMMSAPAQRQYSTLWEACIFAELPGVDSTARGESGYGSALDEARGMVFEPLRRYFVGAREEWGGTLKEIYAKVGSSVSQHAFSSSQWALPTADKYAQLRELFGPGYLRREYEDLRREYEDLRREYEDLRRPFSVERGARNRSDLWTYGVPPPGPDRHPCEKPLDMLRDIIKASTMPGAVVLDCFGGRASVACACVDTKRQFIGCERDARWHEKGMERIADHKLQERPARMRSVTGPLFPDTLGEDICENSES